MVSKFLHDSQSIAKYLRDAAKDDAYRFWKIGYSQRAAVFQNEFHPSSIHVLYYHFLFTHVLFSGLLMKISLSLTKKKVIDDRCSLTL